MRAAIQVGRREASGLGRITEWFRYSWCAPSLVSLPCRCRQIQGTLRYRVIGAARLVCTPAHVSKTTQPRTRRRCAKRRMKRSFLVVPGNVAMLYRARIVWFLRSRLPRCRRGNGGSATDKHSRNIAVERPCRRSEERRGGKE